MSFNRVPRFGWRPHPRIVMTLSRKWVLDKCGQGRWRRTMKDLARYRAMESLCRQSAVFNPLESWRLLAQAEMWHHKALEVIESGSLQYSTPPGAMLSGMEP